MKPILTCIVVAVAALISCSNPADSGGRTPVVQIAEQNVTLSLGDSANLSLLPMLPPGYIPSDVRWSSSNPAIVSVRRISSSRAVATAAGTGTAVVHADAEDAADSTVVVVR